MATSILQQAKRTVRAVGIVERHECKLQDNGAWRVRDTATGSGRWHTVFNGHCTCPDYLVRGATCKHQRAVRAEEQALAQYCADWNARSEQARSLITVISDDLPGNFLDTNLNFADSSLTAEDREWLADDVNRDEYSGPYGSDGWPQPRPCCPDCGAELESRQYYTGGRGYRLWLVCSKDGQHKALPA